MKKQFIASYFLIVFVGMTIVPLMLPLSSEYAAFFVDLNEEEPSPKSIEKLANEVKLLAESGHHLVPFVEVSADKIEYYNHQYDVLYVPPIHLPPPDVA